MGIAQLNMFLCIASRFFTEIVLFYSCLCLKTNGVSVHDVVCACSDAEGLDAGRRESCQGLSVTLDA